MKYVEAGNAEIPSLGFGTFQISGGNCKRAVESALEIGYRHIDTAEYYDNESQVGSAIENSSVDRDELFLTTKVWRSNLHHDDVLDAAESSLERLGVDYIDLLLIHWPHPRVEFSETLEAMEELQENGMIEHIGVSNFTKSQLEEAKSVTNSPIVADQVLYHPFKDQTELREYCVEEGIGLTAYSPLARGGVLGNEVLKEIGQNYNKSETQVALRWLIQQENVIAIPRSTSPEHIEENFEIFDFELSGDEMKRIEDLTPGFRMRIVNKLPSLMRKLPV